MGRLVSKKLVYFYLLFGILAPTHDNERAGFILPVSA